ncbi:MAG TPA: GAF domain-containing protein [Anaerolineales bacterium]|nr:GAF domain-containing protein [Anaerolineales bacterium]
MRNTRNPLLGRLTRIPIGAWYKLYIFAGTQYGFLRLVNWLRVVALIAFTVYIGDVRHGQTSYIWVYTWFQPLLFAYAAFIVYSEHLLIFHPAWFENHRPHPIYVYFDTVMVAISYGIAFDPKSDLYLLYFIPVLVLARFFQPYALIRFLSVVAFVTGLAWVLTLEPESYLNSHLWITVLVPRLGFLGILAIVYMIYHRRRSVSGNVQTKAHELIEDFQRLSPGIFSVDQRYRITAANNTLIERHGLITEGSICKDWFCRIKSENSVTCDLCPLQIAIQSGQAVETAMSNLTDLQGDRYPALISAVPVRNEQGNVLGASAVVIDQAEQDVFRRELLTYSENIERTIDAQTQGNLARIHELNRQIQVFFEASLTIPGTNQEENIDRVLFNIAELFSCKAALVYQPGTSLKNGSLGLTLTNSVGIPSRAKEESSFIALVEDTLMVRTHLTGEKDQVPDIQTRPHLSSFSRLDRSENYHTMICLPLTVGMEKLGVLVLYRDQVRPFSADESDIAQALAYHLATAICNYRLLAEISRQSDERKTGLETLSHFSQQLVPQESLQSLADLVADITCKVLHAESSAVFINEDDRLRRIAICDEDPNWFAEESYLIGQGLTGRAAFVQKGERYGRPVMENAVEESKEVISIHLHEYQHHLKSGQVRHLLAVPLNGQDGTFGVLRVVNKLAEDGQIDRFGFTQHHLEIMTTIACIVAVAMENSRRLEEKIFLMEVGQTITASLSSDEVLSKSLERAVQLLNAEAGFILVKDSTSGDLVFRVTFGTGVARLQNQSLPGNEGVAYQVLRTGEPAIVNEVANDQRFNTWLYQHTGFTTQSLLSVAIQSGNQIIGVIEIANKHNGSFKRTDLDLLSALAPWTAISMENARLFEAEQKRRHLAEALQDSMKVIASNLELQSIFDNIASALAQVVGYDTTSVFLKDGNELILKMHAGFPEDEQLALTHAKLNAKANKPFRRMLRTRGPIMVRDLHKEPILDPIIGTSRIRSWIGAPLLVQNKVIGFLSVDHWEPNQYTEEDVSLVQTFAGQVAIAVHNASLYQQLSHRAAFLQTLQDKVAKITTAKSKTDILNKVALAARDLMNSEISGVALYDEDTQEIYGLPDAGYCGVPQEYVANFRFSINRPGGVILRDSRVFKSEDVLADSVSVFGRRLIEPIGIRGLMAAPLKASRHRVGILYVGSRQPRRFTSEEETFFSILANHAATAIRNWELLESTNRRSQLLELFHQISVVVQQSDDLKVIENIVLTGITAAYGLRFNRAILMLLNERRDQLEGITGIGQTSREDAYRIWESVNHKKHTLQQYVQELLGSGVPEYTPMHFVAEKLHIPLRRGGQSVFHQALEKGQPLVVVPEENRHAIDSAFLQLLDPGEFVIVPLHMSGKFLGIIIADNKWNDAPIRAIDVELLATCANQAAVAIQRSQLHRKLEQQVNALDQLQKVVQSFSELASPQEALRRIALATKELVHADISQLIPYDAREGKLLVENEVGVGFPATFQHNPNISEHGLTRRILDWVSDMLIIEDVETISDLNSHFVKQFDIKSVVGCRLEFAGEIVGVLYVNYSVQHRFEAAELDILRTLAKHAAVAIHNSRLMEENRSLAAQAERSRLREDLHDILGKLQFKISAEAESMYEKLRHKRDQALTVQAKELWRFARHIYEQLERILKDMADPTLPESGLQEALRNLLAEVNFPLEAIYVQGESRASPEVELMFYRICQEAVVNIIKHAQLPKDKRGLVEIRLEQAEKYTRLIVQDHGQGFSPDLLKDKRASIGISSMRARAKKINADIQIDPRPGAGVCIEVLAPRHLEVNI